jgi:S-adenosylmethionine-diacylgycerolhomoserine-N-methlytransferase
MAANGVASGAMRRMDRIYRRQRHIYDLSRRYFLFGRDALIAGLDPPAGADICEVGCGTARNLIRIARRRPWVNLYGLDASSEMLKTASAAVARAGLDGRIALKRGLAERLDPGGMFGREAGFDAVILSYVLSMVPDWRRVLEAALGAARPGGTLEIVDFGDIDRLPPPLNRALRAWLARFEVEPRKGLVECLEEFARQGRGSVAARRVLGPYAVLARFTKAG